MDPLVAFGGPTCGPGQSCPSTNPTCGPGQPGLNTSPLLSDLHAGAVLGDSVLTAAVVDRAGQRPAR